MYSVYWIHRLDQSDLLHEGYVGITSKSVERRFEEHHRNKDNPHLRRAIEKGGCVVTCLHTGLTKDEACAIEKSLRPDENIGWNISPGGNMPPNRKGKRGVKKLVLCGDDRTDAQKKAAAEHSKRMMSKTPWNKGKTGLQTMSEDHRKKISIANSKPKQVVTCPHCQKVGGKPSMMKWHFDKCKKKG